jgi:hypothetical protein
MTETSSEKKEAGSAQKIELQQAVGAIHDETVGKESAQSEAPRSTSASQRGRKIRKIGAFALGAISACAAILTILDYKLPATVPVVQGIDIVVCQDRDVEPSAPWSGPAFLAQIDSHDLGIVFIRDLAVLNYGCWKKRGNARSESEDVPFVYVDDTVKWTSQGRPRGGTLTIGVRNAFLGNPALLEIVAPESDDYLVRTECGAKCFGATGLYKVSSYADGIHHYRLAPVPANSGMTEIYSCTLEKMAAANWFTSLFACRW